MDATKFNNNLNNLKTLNQEQRILFLLGGFNIELKHKPTKKN